MAEQVYIIEKPEDPPSIAVITVEWKWDGKVWQQVSRAAHVYWDVNDVAQQQTGPFISVTTLPKMRIADARTYLEVIQRAIEIAEEAQGQAQRE
jgi:hypothetical protein